MSKDDLVEVWGHSVNKMDSMAKELAKLSSALNGCVQGGREPRIKYPNAIDVNVVGNRDMLLENKIV